MNSKVTMFKVLSEFNLETMIGMIFNQAKSKDKYINHFFKTNGITI